jgi:hypothetical protein
MDFAGTIGHLGTGQVTFWNGAVSGAIFWLGFIATTIAVNHRYHGFGWNLTIIGAGALARRCAPGRHHRLVRHLVLRREY